MTRRFPLHIHISTMFVTLILIVGGTIGWLGFSVSASILRHSNEQLNTRIGADMEGTFRGLVAPAEVASRLLSQSALMTASSLDERIARVGLMREVLKNSEAITSLYVGYGNGDFFMLRRLWNDADRQHFAAPATASYLVQSIDRPGGRPRGHFVFLDASLQTLESIERPDYAAAYDPRQRAWYKAALTADGEVKTPVYRFYETGKVGTTIANRAPQIEAVAGVDIRLETLGHFLDRQKATPGTQIVLSNQQGWAILHGNGERPAQLAADRNEAPPLNRIEDLGPVFRAAAPLLASHAGEMATHHALHVGGEPWLVAMHPIKIEGWPVFYLINAVPEHELMAAAFAMLNHAALTIALVILLAIPVTWALARAISGALRQLAGEVETIRHFDFSQPIMIRSLVLEVDQLADTMDNMKRTIRRFLDISQAIAGEKNFDQLLPRLLRETLTAADADAGILYLADHDELTPVAALFADGSSLPGTPGPITNPGSSPQLMAALASGRPSSGPILPNYSDALGLGEAVSACGATHVIAVPLRNRDDVSIGAMLLLRRDAADEARLAFVGALSGSTAVSLQNKELIHAQKRLFEALIQLIASAIDAKSPYTGGHCARVPELTKMLARAACAASDGPFKDFNLNEDGWEAVHVAAWLHDCGKVTTPEYVVDKATKLETLYDRIHEVRMRFEVLKRDAEIACLKAIAAGAPETDARARLADELRQLDDDFAFIAECNEGGEFMAAEKLERLAAIAGRTWQRTLDDRIGISHEEKERKERTPPPALPVTEPLLADRPEHAIERPPQDRMPPDNKWGFRMPVPELLYNRGELYNLAVARGTLSDEERYKINEHIVQTLIMLSELPFPKHLREVPEIAACHHEKMDGSGYPRRLVREQMGPVARMMAIADIFEALTAVDRPYKKGKTLSEAIRIMSFMKKDQHIDPELFDLFLRSGVYRLYAERFMKPEQIDSVDIAAYLEPAPAA